MHEEPVLKSLVLILNLHKVRVQIPTSFVLDVGSLVIDRQIAENQLAKQVRIS